MIGEPHDVVNDNNLSAKCLGNGSYSLGFYDSLGHGIVCVNGGDSDSGFKLAIDKKMHKIGASFALKEEIAFIIKQK